MDNENESLTYEELTARHPQGGRATYKESLGFVVPFIDLRAQYRSLEQEAREALDRVVKRQWFLRGDEVAAFERDYSRYLDGRRCVGCGSGTDALFLALKALGIGPGDRVIVPALSFVSTVTSVLMARATPVFADVDPKTRTLSAESLEQAMCDGVRAVIAVHLYGYPAAMDEIGAIAGTRGIPVLEDACQSHHARRSGRLVGTLGAAAAFSFYPGKNLGGLSDSGIVAFSEPKWAAVAHVARDYGMRGDEFVLEGGINSHLSEIDAAVLRLKLRHLPAWTRKRREIAGRYTDLLRGFVGCPEEEPEVESAYHAYVIEVPDRDRVEAALIRRGIQVRVHYSKPLHRHAGLVKYHDGRLALRTSERLAKRVLSLPCYPEMSDDNVRFVAKCVKEAVRL